MFTLSQDLLSKLHKPAPRYTSYPTAPTWSQLDQETYIQALSKQTDPLSFYIHIPFCHSMCLYCGCSVILNRKKEREEEYVSYLELEIHKIASHLPQHKISQLHFGGGTPTKLSEDQLSQIMSCLEGHFSFTSSAEIAIEIDPRTVVQDEGKKLKHLATLGFNRVSFGVQDTNEKVQNAVLRRQSYEMTKATYEMARELGFEEINLDLIYGLPYQTTATFKQTVEDILTMRPNRISLFSYAKVPWLKPHQKAIKDHTLPSIEEKFAIYAMARTAFCEAGYVAIGMDHFALKDDPIALAYQTKHLGRNFQGYTVNHAPHMIGLGVTAIGYLGSCYAQNVKDLESYYYMLDHELLPVAKGKVLNDEDQLRKWVIHTIMCHFTLDKKAFHKRYNLHFDTHFADAKEPLEELERDGLIENTPQKLVVTKQGELFVRNIAMVFDAYITSQAKRFSASI